MSVFLNVCLWNVCVYLRLCGCVSKWLSVCDRQREVRRERKREREGGAVIWEEWKGVNVRDEAPEQIRHGHVKPDSHKPSRTHTHKHTNTALFTSQAPPGVLRHWRRPSLSWGCAVWGKKRGLVIKLPVWCTLHVPCDFCHCWGHCRNAQNITVHVNVRQNHSHYCWHLNHWAQNDAFNKQKCPFLYENDWIKTLSNLSGFTEQSV